MAACGIAHRIFVILGCRHHLLNQAQLTKPFSQGHNRTLFSTAAGRKFGSRRTQYAYTWAYAQLFHVVLVWFNPIFMLQVHMVQNVIAKIGQLEVLEAQQKADCYLKVWGQVLQCSIPFIHHVSCVSG